MVGVSTIDRAAIELDICDPWYCLCDDDRTGDICLPNFDTYGAFYRYRAPTYLPHDSSSTRRSAPPYAESTSIWRGSTGYALCWTEPLDISQLSHCRHHVPCHTSSGEKISSRKVHHMISPRCGDFDLVVSILERDNLERRDFLISSDSICDRNNSVTYRVFASKYLKGGGEITLMI